MPRRELGLGFLDLFSCPAASFPGRFICSEIGDGFWVTVVGGGDQLEGLGHELGNGPRFGARHRNESAIGDGRSMLLGGRRGKIAAFCWIRREIAHAGEGKRERAGGVSRGTARAGRSCGRCGFAGERAGRESQRARGGSHGRRRPRKGEGARDLEKRRPFPQRSLDGF